MKKIILTATTGGRYEAQATEPQAVRNASRCIMPIGDEEARLWDEIVELRAKAA